MWGPGLIVDWLCSLVEIAALLVMVRLRSNVSSRLSLAVWVVTNVLMQLVTPQVMIWCDNAIGYSYAIWYGSWIVFNALALWAIVFLHRLAGISASRLTRYISACFFALTFVQIAGYVDRVVVETNLLSSAYRYLVVAVNCSVLPAVFVEFWKYHRDKGAV